MLINENKASVISGIVWRTNEVFCADNETENANGRAEPPGLLHLSFSYRPLSGKPLLNKPHGSHADKNEKEAL